MKQIETIDNSREYVKTIKINLIRGNTLDFKFKLINKLDKTVITAKQDKIYFTVKKDNDTEIKSIQKTLDNGISFTEDGYYHIRLEHDDTCDLYYGDYPMDITIISDRNVKTGLKGILSIIEVATFEGADD